MGQLCWVREIDIYLLLGPLKFIPGLSEIPPIAFVDYVVAEDGRSIDINATWKTP